MKPQDTDKFERSSYWRKVSLHVRQMNPCCQWIDCATGEPCGHPSQCVHHITAPEDNWELRDKVSNLVALCWEHHPNTKGDDGKNDYLPTREVFMTTGVEILHEHPKYGRVAIVATGAEGRQGTSSAISTKYIDAALQGIEKLNLEDF
jgi:hypothetical protein